MEFSYRISEKDYVQAYKLATKRRGGVRKTVLFWAFIVICLTLLFEVILKNSHPTEPEDREPAQTESQPVSAPAHTSVSLAELAPNVVPFVALLAFWGFLIFYLSGRVRRLYRKDTNCHGEVTITLDANSVAIRSTVGTSFQSGWNVFKNWHEGRDLVLLGFPSGTFHIVNIRDLSEAQRGELRGILSAVLPRK